MSDRLTTLPFELFEMIVLFAQSHPQTKHLYVSKAFLPFVRRPIFKATKINSYQKLSTFLELIDSTPAVIPFVLDLEIKLAGEKDVGVPKNKALTKGFAQLSSTLHLTIEHSSRIAKLVLSPINERSLLSMRSLMIKDPLEGYQNPLDPSHFRWLERYLNLYSLHLRITRDINETGRRKRSTSSAEDSANWGINYLGLEAPCINNPSLHDFLSYFPTLYSLNIYELSDENISCLRPILDHLPTIDEIQYLAITSFFDARNPEDLSDLLPRFTTLVELDFGEGTLNQKVFDLLNSSTFPKLEILSFRFGVRISTDQLKSLISGPKKVTNLEQISLNLIVKDPDITGAGDYAFDYDGDWLGPLGFSKDLTPKGLEELVQLADREGVKVAGYGAEFARREIESRKTNKKGMSKWEKYMEI
ncbi:hypothetical protein JCM5353_008585 [Sporobolomyces roseus]